MEKLKNNLVMKAIAVFPQEKKISIIEHPEPKLLSGTEIKIKIQEVGICGTDREIARLEYGTPPKGSPYLVIGHETIGQVVEVGSQVSKIKTGDFVVPMVRRPCWHPECPACRSGRQDFCLTGDFSERGIKLLHGFMTEFIVDEEKYMNFVPPEIKDLAVLVEPLTIAEKGLIQVWDIEKRLPWLDVPGAEEKYAHKQKAVVLGAGPVGLLGTMALLVRGFDTWVYSRDPKESVKAKFVESIGGKYLSSRDIAIQKLPEQIGNIDLIYEATGAATISFQAMEVLGINGVFIFTGVPGRKGPIQIDADLIMRNLVLKNQLVYGTVNAGKDAFEAAILDLGKFAKRWPAQIRQVITGRYPITNYQDLLLGPISGMKRVITFSN
jgi:threonine dehydrogenase-like Zn-dependent dehydrogenase